MVPIQPASKTRPGTALSPDRGPRHQGRDETGTVFRRRLLLSNSWLPPAKVHMRILKRRSPSLATMTLRALADYPITSALVATAGLMAAGEDDRLIDIDEQSGRLHDEIKHSKMRRVPNAGHMIQQSDTADLMAAVDEAAAETLH